MKLADLGKDSIGVSKKLESKSAHTLIFVSKRSNQKAKYCTFDWRSPRAQTCIQNHKSSLFYTLNVGDRHVLVFTFLSLLLSLSWARIWKRFRIPGIDSASLCSLVEAIPGLLKRLQIRVWSQKARGNLLVVSKEAHTFLLSSRRLA
jgi:hypothetical protein